MEDISRELEREIARAKPTPHKASRKRKVLVVDDFGELKSGAYLTVLVRFLAVATLVFGLSTGGLYFLYDHKADENAEMKETLAKLEKKTHQLTSDKEILMARLVMAGEKPLLNEAETVAAVEKADPSADQQATGVKNIKPEVKKEKQTAASRTPAVEPVPEKQPEPAEADVALEENSPVPEAAEPEETPSAASGEDQNDASTTAVSEVVGVEKFSISRTPNGEELRVRFDIRNIKEGPGEISGRIFLVLKPESRIKNNWIVVPKAPLGENGIPTVYRRGQYFSISRFKPVKFTIGSPPNPENLKTAAVYIFDEGGQLIFRDEMPLDLGEE